MVLTIGDPAPWFTCASSTNQQFNFQTIAGRYVVLCFFGSSIVEKNARVINYLTNNLRDFFDDDQICFFGVTIDYRDLQEGKVKQILPGIRYFWDFDAQVSLLYGAIGSQEELSKNQINYNSFTLILDPALRVIDNIPPIVALLVPSISTPKNMRGEISVFLSLAIKLIEHLREVRWFFPALSFMKLPQLLKEHVMLFYPFSTMRKRLKLGKKMLVFSVTRSLIMNPFSI